MSPMIRELPYHPDSAALFSPWAENPWAVFLDSGFPRTQQGRFDVLAAEPYITLTTTGGRTVVWQRGEVQESDDDPFELVRQKLGEPVDPVRNLPFCGGAIGYFAYDLARRLEQLPNRADDAEGIPELAVGIYDWALVVDHQEQRSWLVGQGRDLRTMARWPHLVEKFSQIPTLGWRRNEFRVLDSVQPNFSAEQYGAAFAAIQRYIREGDCYQVNLAMRFAARCEGSPWTLYQRLRAINPAPFSAYLNTPSAQVLSSSPERFLQVYQSAVETKPIKGTRPRAAYPLADLSRIGELRESRKDRAENLMIVDLLRNDLGKTCAIGSIRVPKLFDVESYATVHHLVSTVTGRLADGQTALDLLRGCFPGGSITGAPKLRAMEIIEELEPHRRGVYCGSIGYLSQDGNMDTSIAIRTLVHSDATIRFWAGGGIVADSQRQQEYQECFHKAAAILSLLNDHRIHGVADYLGR